MVGGSGVAVVVLDEVVLSGVEIAVSGVAFGVSHVALIVAGVVIDVSGVAVVASGVVVDVSSVTCRASGVALDVWNIVTVDVSVCVALGVTVFRDDCN